MNVILSLKDTGNRAFASSKFAEACAVYGRCLENLIQLETQGNVSKEDEMSMMELKPTIFLNLAAANMKLGGWDGGRRLCNAALVYCNTPFLLLDDLGVNDDINDDTELFEPIIPDRRQVIIKSMYRRGQCLHEMGQFDRALRDFEYARNLAPTDKLIKAAIETASNMKEKVQQLAPSQEPGESSSENDQSALSTADISDMTCNGGSCLSGKGYWSQSVCEARIYLLLNFIMPHYSKVSPAERKLFKIEFLRMEVRISFAKELLASLQLEYIIKPSECTWSFDSLSTMTTSRDSPNASQVASQQRLYVTEQKGSATATISGSRNLSTDAATHLVLDLCKSPSVEWFPGCEWWDRVFVDDEPIDTSTCTIGADVGQLPNPARERAEKEHIRFTTLPSHLQSAERDGFAKLLKESRTALAETDSEVGTNTNSGGPGTRGALTAGPTLDSASTVHESDLDAVSVAASHTTDFTHSGVGGISGSAAGANTEGSKSLQSHSYSSCAGCETEKECCEDELTEARLHAFEEANIDGDAGTGAFDDEVLDALRSQFPHIDFKVREI